MFTGKTKIDVTNDRFCLARNVDFDVELENGGQVLGVLKIGVDHYYNYRGVEVAGNVLVKEDEEWVEVKQSAYAVPIYRDSVLYGFVTVNGEIEVNGSVFKDMSGFIKELN